MKRINTPQSNLAIAGWGRVSAGVLIDFFTPVLTMGCVASMIGWAGAPLPDWLSAVEGLAALLYTFFAYRGRVPSIGRWALGITRTAHASSPFVHDEVPNSILSRRTIILSAYLALVLSTLWLV